MKHLREVLYSDAYLKGVPETLRLPVVEPGRITARWAKPKAYAQPAWTRDKLSREERLRAIREHRKAISDDQEQYRRLHRPEE